LSNSTGVCSNEGQRVGSEGSKGIEVAWNSTLHHGLMMFFLAKACWGSSPLRVRVHCMLSN